MVKKNYIIGLLISALIVMGCAGTTTTLQEPTEGKNLIIGSIIFENNGYQNRNEVYTSNIEVAVMGIYEEDGKEKVFGKWTMTDKDGYFFMSNVPDGKYAVKAIRINLAGQAFFTIANEFRTMVDNYKIWPSENVAFSGIYFNTRPVERIINLKHNYFTFFVNQEIRYGAYDMVREFQASNGEMISRPLIFRHFVEKYPESGWNQYLNKVLSTYEEK
jgi:hypothetical protein